MKTLALILLSFSAYGQTGLDSILSRPLVGNFNLDTTYSDTLSFTVPTESYFTDWSMQISPDYKSMDYDEVDVLKDILLFENNVHQYNYVRWIRYMEKRYRIKNISVCFKDGSCKDLTFTELYDFLWPVKYLHELD